MAKKKLTDLQLIAESLNSNDLFHIVNVSDVTENAAGSSRKVTLSQLLTFIGDELVIDASEIDDLSDFISNNEDVLANTANRHSHANLALLDTYNQTNADIISAISHISDMDNPHGVTKSQIGLGNVLNVAQIPATEKGSANGVATLDSNSKIPSSQIPSLAISETYVVASEIDMLAIDAQIGDIAIRTDVGHTYILSEEDATLLSSWTMFATPTDAVQTVNGQTGTVLLDTDDIDEGLNLYFTSQRALDSVVHTFAFDPTTDDDEDNTSGNGTFTVGEMWLNTIDGGLFQAHDVDTGDAQWREVVKLNGDGELVGVFIPRHDLQATIDTIVLEDGEIAFTTDRHEVRLGDGVTAGGIQAEVHETSGEVFDLSGSSVSNLVLTADTGGSTIPSLAGYDVRWTARVTAYKLVNGEYYLYGSSTSAPVTIPGTESYDISIDWDTLAGADGYMVEIETYFPALSLTYHAFTAGYRPTATNNHVPVNVRPSQSGSDAVNWVAATLNFPNSYYDTALILNGSLDIKEVGVIKFNGIQFMGKSSKDNLYVGVHNFLGTGSYAFGDNNTVGDAYTPGGIAVGSDNVVTIGTVFGSNNSLTSGVVVGNNNISTDGTIVGSGNLSNFSGDTIVGSGIVTSEKSAIFGEGGSLGSLNKIFGMNLTSANFATFTQKASFGVELNKSTIIEDISRTLGFSLYKNSLHANAGTNWVLGADWRKTSFVRYEKFQDGTSTLTPSNNPIEVGKRYVLQIRFSSDYPFEGSCVVTAGGVTIGTYTKDGTYTATFTAISTATLTFTPSSTSRFSTYGAYLEEMNSGDLTVLGDINFGAGHSLSQDGFGRMSNLTLSSSGRGPEKIRNKSNVATTGTTGVSVVGWTLGSGWTYNNTTSLISKSANGTATLTQPLASMYTEFVVGKVYELTYTITNWTVGTVTPTVAGVPLTARSANGTYTEQFTAVSNTALIFTPSNTARFAISAVSIKSVIDVFLNVDGDVTGDLFITTGGDSDDWNTAFGWGDHASAGYLTSFTETDPIYELEKAIYLKKDGSIALTSNWDIGDTMKILTDGIRARDAYGLELYDDGGNGIFIKDGGNVGIGISAPTQKLDVQGNIQLPTTTSSEGALYQNGKRLLHTYGTSNVFLGIDSAGTSITGGFNTGIGERALQALTSGSFNFALGRLTLYKLTTGTANIGIGSSTLTEQTTQSYNVGIGFGNLIGNLGNGNVAIGHEAGRQTALAGTATNNVFIGYRAGSYHYGSATNLSNAIAIGGGAVVTQSNSFILGGLGSDAVSVGIGTSAPSAFLHVIGATEQLRLGYDASNYWNATTDSVGLTTFNAVGTNPEMIWSTGNIERMKINSSGNIGIGTTAPTAKLDINSDVLRLRTAKTPATAGATGNVGDIAWDSDYMYVCVATNTWKRTALSTW